MKRILMLLTSVLLASCSGADLLNTIIPREGYRVAYDLPYGGHARQKLDIYTPDGIKNAPVIIFIYGGSWKMGSKDQYRFLGQAFASKGFVVAVIDYRLYPEVRYPAFVEDGAKAVRYVRDHIASYGGDPHNMFLAGHSAGAFNALTLGADASFLAKEGVSRDELRGIIGIAGPYDFLPFDSDTKPIFAGTPDAATQPINRITGPMPPVFLAHGRDDDTVYLHNSRNVKAKLEKLGSPVVLKTYEDISHIDIMLALANGFRGRAPLLADITAFVQDHRKK